ncbi:hypothetical protein OsJ_16723 [Oryza sativa Japonica Group]|uniref:DUF6598 domain-containing protein n=1 Tax=Oryza sativa subsp. japonica TaxID=39947 RepID=B9FDQ6_ORYSJ|nr:hypothetical protein OsJ_16723 [Oryza sativa Japonica Group]
MEAAETKGRGGGEGRKCRREEEEAFAAKSRRIDDQDDEERMNNYTPMLEEEEDGCRDSRCAELVFGEEEELDPVQMEEKLRQVKLELQDKYTEVDEEEQIRNYRTSWDSSLSSRYGPFQCTTSVPAMRYTHGPIARYACCDSTLQIFSIEVDSFLELTGPSRAILIVDPVEFDVELKVKGRRESDDQILSFQLFRQNGFFNGRQSVTLVRRFHPIMLGWYSKFKFTYAVLNGAVEATICRVKVVRGSWTKEYQGRIVCTTSSICHEDFMLLDSQDAETMPIGSDDVIKLSRRVVTVELSGELTVSLTATHVGKRTRDDDGGIAQNDEALFTTDKVRFRPKKSGESCATCKLGFCEVEITVAWSLLNCDNIE